MTAGHQSLIAVAKREIRAGDVASQKASKIRNEADKLERSAAKLDTEAEAHWTKAGKALFALQQKVGKEFRTIVVDRVGISVAKAYDFMKMPGVRPADYKPATGGPKPKEMSLADHRAKDLAAHARVSMKEDVHGHADEPTNVVSLGARGNFFAAARQAARLADEFEKSLSSANRADKDSALHEARITADRWAAIVAHLAKRSA